jgi:two-component system phosphate regulon response regulator PhoB
MPMTDTDDRLERLHQRYADSLRAKSAELADAWRAFAASPDDAASARELSMQVHRLCGSAAAYGYRRLGDSACAADRLIAAELASATCAHGEALVRRFTTCVQDVLAELAAASAKVQSPLAGRNLRVVLVEDDPAQASLTAAELEARGCCVQVEDSGDRLWLTLVQQPCDAVVLDYWLRAETAAEIAVALRREPQFARIALVCYSVERDEQVLRAVLAAGCDAVVAKDDGADRLFAAASAAVTRMRRRGAPEPRS